MVRQSLLLLFLAGLLAVSPGCMAQSRKENPKLAAQLNEFVVKYASKRGKAQDVHRMLSFKVDDRAQRLELVLDNAFAKRDFTSGDVDYYYRKLAKSLPKPYNRYGLTIKTAGLPIEQLAADALPDNDAFTRFWAGIDYKGDPWVQNVSRPYGISHGLRNRHISLWASHGIYYDAKKSKWKWQRPNLFCTNEDLFTQTIVVPYLIPMLERAGAVVYTPRERDWQTNEVIVDNDDAANAPTYVEDDGKKGWTVAPEKGFGRPGSVLRDGDNPFRRGTARMAETVKKRESWISYQPAIPEDGRYAVYVSYQTRENSIPNAEYIVIHRGQRTVFHVNQQMGGSTWVYLGTFDFARGCDADNRVVVTNLSPTKGVVTTDAVRFGGGMGTVERGGSVSSYPRCLEAARYNVQWSGAPYSVYSSKSGADDYADDINSRSLMSNWLAGGSVFVPTLEGKKVPIELSLAVHSDAGYSLAADSIIGSLSICTTNFNDGRLNSGISRLVSRDFADSLLAGVQRDLKYKYRKWTRRYLYDRNYSETRKPEVPSSIIETLSHQNFADMLRGHDPNFKFTLARSLYKTILRFVNGGHGHASVVAPLAPVNFTMSLGDNGELRLSWTPVDDPQEPTACATAYNVYVAKDGEDFGNGEMVDNASYVFEPEQGVVYRFRVTAVNRGGESFPTETLAACVASRDARKILAVNAFTRLSSPAVVNTGMCQGFDFDADPGVSYGLTAGWLGRQQCFDKATAGMEGPGGLGYSDESLAGNFVMGNSFDGIVDHVRAIAQAGNYNVLGSSVGAVECGNVTLADYDCVDMAFGLQKDDGHSLVYYKTFTPALRGALKNYVGRGGRLVVSGAYVGTDMGSEAEKNYLASLLKCGAGGCNSVAADDGIDGLGQNFRIVRTVNKRHFAATAVDVLNPQPDAFCAMKYADGTSAAVAYDGSDYKCITMGFPFECIADAAMRSRIMKGMLNFVLK